DCDREGENIGFEVIQVCREVNPNLRVLRAHFSEITVPAINRALNTFTEPDKRVSGLLYQFITVEAIKIFKFLYQHRCCRCQTAVGSSNRCCLYAISDFRFATICTSSAAK